MDNNSNLLLQEWKTIMSRAEERMFEYFGMRLYKNDSGFSQEEIYNLCGRDDSVATITFRIGSQAYLDYGEDLTVCFIYTPKERQKLESNTAALNGLPCVKARILLPGFSQIVENKLLTAGVNSHDIVKMIVLPGTKQENKYNSHEKRSSHSIDIPFEPYGNGEDIKWMYGFLLQQKNQGIGLTPDEYAEYLAYKIVLDFDGLTEEEHNDVFNDQGLIYNNEVAWNYINWKKSASLLTDKDKKHLDTLTYHRVTTRLYKLDEHLKGIGGLVAFSKKYKDKANLIVDKVLRFRQHRYNIQGKHLLYMDLDGFLHIYLRHVEELNTNGLYPQKTKFQLKERDVETVISNVMCSLNDEYQAFRDASPNRQFRKYDEQSFYYKGDYYVIRVESDGRLVQFYKLGTKAKS